MIEFATHGYENSSTNRIVKECGISKGSLFKYFKSKEELYFYLIEIIFSEMSKEIETWITKISKDDICQRVIDFCTLEMLWYVENPIKGSFVITATSDSNTKIFKKTITCLGYIHSSYQHFLDSCLFSTSWKDFIEN